MANHELELAEVLVQQIIVASPETAAYHDTYGLMFFQKEAYLDALENYEKAYELDGNDPIINEHLGDVLFKLGETERAIEFWSLAKETGGKGDLLDKKIKDKKYYAPND